MQTACWKRNSGLILAAALLALCTTAQGASKYEVLHNFTGGADGNGNSGVTLDQKGNLYAPSLGGGTGNCRDGCGLILELSRKANGKWHESVLYNFQRRGCGEPLRHFRLRLPGNLYGTTVWGGAHGYGTVFELARGDGGWSEKLLHSFCGPQPGCTSGGAPQAGVVMDGAGNLYGTAGVAYELSPDGSRWKETVLHRFTGESGDGYGPFAGLIRDQGGNLYGTTQLGGLQCGSSTCGTVYQLSPQADGRWKETILFRFNGKNGAWPGAGALYMDGSGALYGTTENGGSYGGVVFKLTPEAGGRWSYAILYEFEGGAGGWLPDAGVVMDKSGNLYGTTDGGGGPSGCGGIYRLAPQPEGKWKYTVLHRFSGPDGCAPAGNLAIDQSGNLYGGTVLGGKYGYGAVFELTP
jgi:uncharacterized repeat protein (TIGR03803 family)